jgi:choline dehydrogenase-like flavoprotein
MIIDLDTLPAGSTRECELCVIGSGAAGLAIAHALRGSGIDLLMLESGANTFEKRTQELYRAEVSALPIPGHIEGRFRTFGGSTTQWGGQSLPFTPMDFAERDWVPNSGWPIARAELEPYYAEAVKFLFTDSRNFDTELFALFGMTPPAFDAAVARFHFSKWSPRPNLKRTYGRLFEMVPGYTLCCHANVTGIGLSGSHDRVTEVTARSFSGNTLTVKAKHVVLCTGGIETARVLLASNTQQKQGVGNGNDLVGRYFQDHPGLRSNLFTAKDPDRVQEFFNTRYEKGRKYTARLSASPDFQRANSTLNASVHFRFEPLPGSPYQVLRDAVWNLRYGRGYKSAVKAFAGSLLHLPTVSRPVYEYAVRKRAWSPDPDIRVGMLTEQEPSRDSRVTLSTQTDELGVPRSRINWQLTDLTRRTILAYSKAVNVEFERLGFGRIDLDPSFEDPEGNWRPFAQDHKHHVGTARMSHSPSTGVVDPRCRVHGIENLWVASGAVFPTSAHSNPTLTIIAVSMRVAETVAAELGKALPAGSFVSTGKN